MWYGFLFLREVDALDCWFHFKQHRVWRCGIGGGGDDDDVVVMSIWNVWQLEVF